ncbi:MAG: carbohydrate ABC transporter permease [Pelatocladus maniniholoensis HA4357-MV3]|jgi:multiple sugar transport system permease protein|uniref:Carbohydrate ABC transporter permease n=1 Tax=Pelatocladus maniniholoensis HA4357-MV3 TaxID=1117104 RepID=A0A9E3HAK1_9NOST|nr:carbohydrate ABC transporter permease [Pelatocladus maniniholoensis HA4357-MV3]BAZ69837.1 ABC-type transporter, integral membrane subunit [Fischerella sp. NIES-4106]
MTAIREEFTTNPQNKAKANNSGKRILLWVAIASVMIFCLSPIMWQLVTSFKVNQDISQVPTVYFPTRLTLDHYINLFSRRPFWRYILNSAFVSFVSTAFALAIGAPAAYALARLRPRGNQLILASILIVTLFPGILLFQGLLEIVQGLHLGNNYLALIIPYTAINLPLTILVLRSFFLQLPKDLEDSAKIDGYNTWQMLIQILLPMTIPALVTTGILTFIFAWNEFIFALTFITREDMKTIPVAAAQLSGASTFEIPYGPIAAATVVGTLPLVLLVLFFQRKIVQGLTAGAVKG